MNLLYFAHNGVEHATSAGAAAHEASGNTLAILAVTVVAVVILALAVRFLSRPHAAKPAKPEKKEN
jgi:hypothetical protein